MIFVFDNVEKFSLLPFFIISISWLFIYSLSFINNFSLLLSKSFFVYNIVKFVREEESIGKNGRPGNDDIDAYDDDKTCVL